MASFCSNGAHREVHQVHSQIRAELRSIIAVMCISVTVVTSAFKSLAEQAHGWLNGAGTDLEMANSMVLARSVLIKMTIFMSPILGILALRSLKVMAPGLP